MTFDAAAVDSLFSEVVSHASSTGLFDRVAQHEPKNAPGNGLSCVIWQDAIDPVRSSGLASVSGRVTLKVRIYSSLLAKPEDAVEPKVMTAAATLMSEYCGHFTLDGTVRFVDLLGAEGTPLSARSGYIEQDGKHYRVMEITLPVIISDMFGEAA